MQNQNTQHFFNNNNEESLKPQNGSGMSVFPQVRSAHFRLQFGKQPEQKDVFPPGLVLSARKHDLCLYYLYQTLIAVL